jgi:hypothetical protein
MRLQSIHTGFSLASGAFLSEQRLLRGPYVDILFGTNLGICNDGISRCSTASCQSEVDTHSRANPIPTRMELDKS